MRRQDHIIPITSKQLKKLIKEGATLSLETVEVNGRKVWRVNARIPGQFVIHRLVTFNTYDERYFKSLQTVFEFFCEFWPHGEGFYVQMEPQEVIQTGSDYLENSVKVPKP